MAIAALWRRDPDESLLRIAALERGCRDLGQVIARISQRDLRDARSESPVVIFREWMVEAAGVESVSGRNQIRPSA